MREIFYKPMRVLLLASCLLLLGTLRSAAQDIQEIQELQEIMNDSVIHAATDSILHLADSMTQSIVVDTTAVAIGKKAPKKDWSTWRPDPKRALWLALVIPGGGQIYNRKYWKLPLVYGGFMGCIYAMVWNNSMYKDYSQAYLDLKDNDPGTASYNQFLHTGVIIDDKNAKQYEDIFKKRRDKYRRWRDLSFFVMVGVYALSVIDAYVDAELSNFDISKDLSLKVEPTIINNHSSSNMFDNSSVGLQCSLNF